MLTELEALTILTSIPNLGSVKTRVLMKHYGSPLAALEADAKELDLLPGFGKKISSSWSSWKNDRSWEKNLELAEKHGIQMIPFTDKRYPKRLLQIVDHPVLLYVKGTLCESDYQSIAVVGTRSSTIYGNEMAETISSDLASMGMTIVSGLARGIDTSAHRGALKQGRTIAVIGSGLADIYPRENIPLAQKITENGALISEFPMLTPPAEHTFPQRNRTVSGLSLGVVLIEAPIKSGAMITMSRAIDHERKLYALPGRVDHENFKGNHSLIKSGKAKLIESAQDIVEDMDSLFMSPAPKKTTSVSKPLLESEEEELLRILPSQEVSYDEIIRLTKASAMKLNVLLMSLVLKKALKEFPGKIYKKK